jgi:hypothetical protein
MVQSFLSHRDQQPSCLGSCLPAQLGSQEPLLVVVGLVFWRIENCLQRVDWPGLELPVYDVTWRLWG